MNDYVCMEFCFSQDLQHKQVKCATSTYHLGVQLIPFYFFRNFSKDLQSCAMKNLQFKKVCKHLFKDFEKLITTMHPFID